MTRTTLARPQGTLVIERELIPVHYLSDLDAGWRYTDRQGHVHHCDYGAADHYPTLRTVIEKTYWCEGCGDEHEDSHLECRQCGEVIRPAMTGPGVKNLAGPVTYTLDGELITAERARQIVTEWGR